MLEVLGLGSISAVWFYVFAGTFLAIVLGIRIAYLETNRVVPIRITKYNKHDLGRGMVTTYFRVEVKNISFTTLDTVMATIEDVKDFESFNLPDVPNRDTIDLPFVLLTQERLRQAILGRQPKTERWKLDPGETKNIEIFQTNTLEELLYITHETGKAELMPTDIKVKIVLSGAGSIIKFWVYFFNDGCKEGGKQAAYIVRDSMQQLVLGQFSKAELLVGASVPQLPH